MLREVALGVELHSLDRLVAVAKAHERPVVRPGNGLERPRQLAARDAQRMVPRRPKRARQPSIDALPVVTDRARPPMQRARRSHDSRTVGLADALVPELVSILGGGLPRH